MPSDEMRAFNAHAKATMKALFNSNFDPVAFRAARQEVPAAELDSTFVDVGAGKLEYRKLKGMTRVVAYVAGGGFCFDAGDNHRQLVDQLAHSLQADACLIRYRLAPEHPFPAAFDDVSNGLDRLIADWGASKVVLVGDSAGAALILSATLARIAQDKPIPLRLAFLSALTDMAMTGRSHVENADADPLFGPQAIIHKAYHYLQGHNPTDPAASPYWADPTGLPACLFVVGSTEVMRDDSASFVAKAKAAGVDARLSIYDEAPHTFPLLAPFPESTAAIQEVSAFFQEEWT